MWSSVIFNWRPVFSIFKYYLKKVLQDYNAITNFCGVRIWALKNKKQKDVTFSLLKTGFLFLG